MINNGIMGQMAAQLAQMPDDMLVQMAKSPPVDIPGAQYMALSILGERAKQKLNPQPQGPQPSVLDQMAMQSQAPGPMGPGNPIEAGAQALMAQQPVTQAQAQQMLAQQPKQLADGSQVPIGTEDYYDYMRRGIFGLTPEDAKRVQAEFAGPDYLSGYVDKIAGERGDLKKDLRFNRFMALADYGRGVANSKSTTLLGGLADGMEPGLASFGKAQAEYRAGKSDIDKRLFALDMARQARSDKQGELASGIFADAQKADRDARSSALGISTEDRRTDKRIAADRRNTLDTIAAANERAKLENSLLNLANRYMEMGYSQEEALTKAQDYYLRNAGRMGGGDDSSDWASYTDKQLNDFEYKLQSKLADLKADGPMADPDAIAYYEQKLKSLRDHRAGIGRGIGSEVDIGSDLPMIQRPGGGVASGASAASEGVPGVGSRPMLNIPKDQQQKLKERLYDGSGRYIGTARDGYEIYKDPAG